MVRVFIDKEENVHSGPRYSRVAEVNETAFEIGYERHIDSMEWGYEFGHEHEELTVLDEAILLTFSPCYTKGE